ncbi:MAG: DUF5627 domain-containing protein [Prolixibacteraceae bacterium]
MKKNRLLVGILLISGICSCENEPIEFPDFEYTTTCFPYQYPVRTLVLGDYVFDNENDNKLKFIISARVGGTYENREDITVGYQIDPGLAANLATEANLFDGKVTASSDALEILPEQYYELNPDSRFIISKGQFTGGIEVQLTDAFLDDPKAVLTRYVLPVRIVSSTTDSILSGRAIMTPADPRKSSHWAVLPKDYTIFGIKYVNAYHGKYLRRGRSVITDNSSNVVETRIIRQKYVEDDEVWGLQTIGRNKVRVTATLYKTPSSPGKYTMDLAFAAGNTCTVSAADGSAFPVTGTGKFVKKGDKWGNVDQDAINLDYVVTEGNYKHAITDTLVFRDKAVTFLEYKPVVLP